MLEDQSAAVHLRRDVEDLARPLKDGQNDGVADHESQDDDEPRFDPAHAPDDRGPEGILLVELAAACVVEFDRIAFAA